MPAPHASQTQNQIASLRMREHDAIELPSAPFDAIPPMQGLSALPADCRRDRHRRGHRLWRRRQRCRHACAHRHDGGAGDRRAVLPLRLLRRLHPLRSARARSPRSSRRPPTVSTCGVMIARRDGEPVYANSTFEAMVGRGERDRLVALQQFLAGDAAASAALFRLTRAAERGEALAEEFAVGRLHARRAHAAHAAAVRQPVRCRRRRRRRSRAVAPHRRHGRSPARSNASCRRRGAARAVRRRADRSRLGRRPTARCCTSTARWRAGSAARRKRCSTSA